MERWHLCHPPPLLPTARWAPFAASSTLSDPSRGPRTISRDFPTTAVQLWTSHILHLGLAESPLLLPCCFLSLRDVRTLLDTVCEAPPLLLPYLCLKEQGQAVNSAGRARGHLSMAICIRICSLSFVFIHPLLWIFCIQGWGASEFPLNPRNRSLLSLISLPFPPCSLWGYERLF